MSCWMISDDHADALVSAYRRVSDPNMYRADSTDMRTDTEIGRMLLGECHASVHHRYHAAEALPDSGIAMIAAYRHRPIAMTVTPTTAARAITAARCYAYQACEHPGWESSEEGRQHSAASRAGPDALPIGATGAHG